MGSANKVIDDLDDMQTGYQSLPAIFGKPMMMKQFSSLNSSDEEIISTGYISTTHEPKCSVGTDSNSSKHKIYVLY